MANPVPEILPEVAREARPDAIIATGRSDYPNQVNNSLCFPYIFRGALDCRASTINKEMEIAAMNAIAALAEEKADPELEALYGRTFEFGRDYFIPMQFDKRLLSRVAPAVAKAAADTGVARAPITDMDAYRKQLAQYVK
jgi:malate dehydrogenase (oxaloacetate-decarboxylating)(NADP+)